MKKKYPGATTTKEDLYVLKATNSEGTERILQITHASRLLKLAEFIFHIFDVDIEGAEFDKCIFIA